MCMGRDKKCNFYHNNIELIKIILENSAGRLFAGKAFKGKDVLPGIMDEVSDETVLEENSSIDLRTFLCILLDSFSFYFQRLK